MTAYTGLLALDVFHRFGADGRCNGLQFEPASATARWLHRAGAVSRRLPARLEVFLPAEQLARRADDDVAPLTWMVRQPAPNFRACTGGWGDEWPPAPGQAFFFDGSRLRADDDGGPPWMHLGANAGPEDLRCAEALVPHDDATPREQLEPGRRSLPPDFVVSLPWPLLRDGGAAFRIGFAARAAVWKYCLLGDWRTDAPAGRLRVVDLQPDDSVAKADFHDAVPERLDDGRPMLAIRSKAPLELRQHSLHRPQLRSHDDADDDPSRSAGDAARHRVLVPRLPVAGADHLALETIQDRRTLVSEIYVHR